MMQRLFFNFILAIEGVLANKMRAILTGLGIMFGVGAVIAMLAIGTGAKQAILEQMKLIGTNNIVVSGVVSSEEFEGEDSGEEGGAQEDKTPWSPGLTINDAQSIATLIPTISEISPEIVLPVSALKAGKMFKTRCVGVSNTFFKLNNLNLEIGHFFHNTHMEGGKPVCIIGNNIATRLFSAANPLGKTIKCGSVWLTVIGVLENKAASKESLQNLGIRNYNNDVYVPVSTALLRYKNRAYIGKDDIQKGRGGDDNGSSGPKNYHQLDRMVIQVDQPENLRATADVVSRMLKRRHEDLVDFELEIPELLLEQQQKTQETFNLVLAVIAGISLLVGGIGIMNIMLASVLERIKEIGVRRSLGAKRTDIIWQFLFEAIFISLLGGLIGVFIGILAAEAIASSADIPTVVSGWSIILSFGVAASVGLVFGIFPAQKAANQDPIKALRTD